MTTSTSSSETQCEHCHKHLSSRRISLIFLIKDAFSNIFNLERGFFFTLYNLLIHPGKVINAFVSGDRYRYMNPFRLLITVATIAVLVESFTHTIDFISAIKVKGTDQESNQVILDFMQQYMNAFILLNVPLLSFGTFVVFLKRRWNFSEHLVLNAYAFSAISFVGTLISIFAVLLPDSIRLMLEGSSQVLTVFLIYVFIDTWKTKWYWSILGFLGAMITTVVMAAILFALIMFTLGNTVRVTNVGMAG